MEEREDLWNSLCHDAWVEDDPVKLLEVTMKIGQFLARKQRRLDAEYDAICKESESRKPMN